jgi:tetraacyldisaccharide 4'-kinase
MTDPLPLFESALPRPIAASLPASACAKIYGAAVTARNRRYDRTSSSRIRMLECPVISIGGIRAGGTGKTPVTILVAELLQSYNLTIGILSRGYKRKGRNSLCIAPDESINWEAIGDEPAMMRQRLPRTWLGIGADRFENGRRLSERMGKRSVLLLDDGFQHRRLHRDLDIVCIHETLFSDRLLPQGYLREPVESLARANLFFLISAPDRLDRMKNVGRHLAERYPSIGQFFLQYEHAGWVNFKTGALTETISAEHPVAVCGIARPERFFDTIDSLSIRPCRKLAFPDHFRYTDYYFRSLRELYSQGLITTEKDAVRLRGLSNIPAEQSWYLKMRLKFAENESFDRFHHYIRNIDSPLLKEV